MSNAGWLTATDHGTWFRVDTDSSTNYVSRLLLYLNALSGTIPAQIGQFTSLTLLLFTENSLSGTIPTQIGQLTSLTGLYIYGNALSGSIPDSVCDLPSIVYGFYADCVNCVLSKPGCCDVCY